MIRAPNCLLIQQTGSQSLEGACGIPVASMIGILPLERNQNDKLCHDGTLASVALQFR